MKDIFKIKPATIDDVQLILSFIKELAEYEKLAHEVVATEDILKETLFGDKAYAEVIILSSTYMEKHAPIQGDWIKQQQQWLNKNPHSKIIQIKSGHFIQLQHPELVCDQLQQLVRLVVQ